MVKYEDFQLDEHQIDAVKKMHQTQAVMEYIRANGVEPSDISVYYTATEDELERHRRAFYAQYAQNQPKPNKPLKFSSSGNQSIIAYITQGDADTDGDFDTYNFNLEYSYDGKNWTKLTGTKIDEWEYDFEPLDISNTFVYVRGDNPDGLTKSDGWYADYHLGFATSTEEPMFCEGNIMSLLGEQVNEIPCDYCFSQLFQGCTSLTTAPELPATALTSSCYAYMFYGCTSLTTAPELPATTLADNCYGAMFEGCTNLNSVTCLATNISANDCTNSWLYGVSSTGTFTTPASTNWPTGDDGIPSGWTRVDA